MTYWRKMWVFSMPVIGNQPMTGFAGVCATTKPLICPWDRAFRGLTAMSRHRRLDLGEAGI
jgi:hypothetical protein